MAAQQRLMTEPGAAQSDLSQARPKKKASGKKS
jgi:hypothetical protein